MRRDVRLTIITEAIERLIPGATPAFLSVEVTETVPGTGERKNTWTGRPATVAERVFTALYGRPGTTEQLSPLAQADQAKRARSIEGEIGALMQAGVDLASAPWHPARPGDLVHVHYEKAGDFPAFGETYVVGDARDGLMNLQLLAHTCPLMGDELQGAVGCFEVDAADEPLFEAWFEAGPHRLTIVRDGLVVHDGPSGKYSRAVAAGMVTIAQSLTVAVGQAIQYLERGEPELALARLRSDKPLPPCGTPGPMPEHADCARPRGHRPPCSPDADYTTPPHECPALPEQLHAVLTVDAKSTHVHIAGVSADRANAIDHASGFAAFREDLTERYVKPAPGLPGEVMLELPLANERHVVGVQLAVVAPLRMLPDLRAEDELAAEGMATALGPEDYADDFRDVDE